MEHRASTLLFYIAFLSFNEITNGFYILLFSYAVLRLYCRLNSTLVSTFLFSNSSHLAFLSTFSSSILCIQNLLIILDISSIVFFNVIPRWILYCFMLKSLISLPRFLDLLTNMKRKFLETVLGNNRIQDSYLPAMIFYFQLVYPINYDEITAVSNIIVKKQERNSLANATNPLLNKKKKKNASCYWVLAIFWHASRRKPEWCNFFLQRHRKKCQA